MSILEKYHRAMDGRDRALLEDSIHDDYQFLMHASGKSLSKKEVIEWAMSGDVVRSKVRIIYENDEIGVDHAFVSFQSDGNQQAVLAVYKFKDGKVVYVETGATNLPK